MTETTPAEALKAAMRDKFEEALKVAYRRNGGLARLIRQTNGAAVIRRIACLESDAILTAALAALPRPPAADAGEVREKAWATDDDPIADLAIKLAARATALEEAHGEWTWRDIAKCAVDALAPSQTFADGIEAAAKLVRDRATFWRSRRGRCSASLEAECIDLATAIRKLGA